MNTIKKNLKTKRSLSTADLHRYYNKYKEILIRKFYQKKINKEKEYHNMKTINRGHIEVIQRSFLFTMTYSKYCYFFTVIKFHVLNKFDLQCYHCINEKEFKYQIKLF